MTIVADSLAITGGANASGTDVVNFNSATIGSAGLMTTITINLGAGTNEVQLADGTFANTGAFTVTGTSGMDTVVGPNANNTWTVTGADDATLAGGAAATLTDIETLIGGSSDDLFTFMPAGVISGQINGMADGGGGDTVDVSLATTAMSLQLGAGAAGLGIQGIELVIGDGDSGASVYVLVGPNVVNAWAVVSGVDDGTLGTLMFQNFSNLVGGTDNDTFTFTGAASLTGQINGMADGGEGDTVDVSLATTALSLQLEPGASGLGIQGIELVIGDGNGGASVHALVGPNVVNAWAVVSGVDDGTLGTLVFQNVSNLVGGTANDTFTFAAAASLTGQIDGFAGADTINIDAVTGPVTITLTDAAADNGTDTGGYDGTIPSAMTNGFSNITVIVGTGDGDELIGDDQAATWTLDGGTETYATDAGGDPDLTFSNVTDLTGGPAADTFDLGVDVGVTVKGGAGDDSFNVNVSLGATTNLEGGDDSDTFSLADGVSVTNAIDGGGGGTDVDELVGAATLATTFTPTADGDGNITGGATATYTDIENLSGGTGADIFNFNTDGSSTAGTVIHTGTIDGGGSGDSYIFTNDAELLGTINDTGASGNDLIDVSGTNMDVNDNPDAGDIVSRINRKNDGTGETDSINNGSEPTNVNAASDDFGGIENVLAPVIQAAPGGSTFVITADGTVDRDGEGAQTGILRIEGASDAGDVFIFDDIALLAGIGGIGIVGGDITGATEFEDRIEIRNTSGNITSAQFDIDGVDTGSITIDGKTTEFVGVESLLGLDGIADLFNFTGTGFIRGQIDGRGGSDTGDYSGVSDTIAFAIALDETITAALVADAQSGVVNVETLTGQATNPELFTIAGGTSFTLTAAQTDAGSVTGSSTTAAFTN